MYYVTFYQADPAQFHRVLEVYPRHRAYLDEFAKGGQIAMIGTFGNPLEEGSMAVFRSREAAESFMSEDPFLLEGLLAATTIREWDPLEYPAVRAVRSPCRS